MKYLTFSNLAKTSFVFFILCLNGSSLKAQCPVTAFASPQSVFCGDSVTLNAIADGCKPLNNNFNSGAIGPNWQATTGAVVTDGTGTYACAGPPPEGLYYIWMGGTVGAPRNITTNDFDLTQCGATSGSICFDMKYATQAGPGVCEGIDLPAEGISVQYSLNGGTTWITIQYYDPNGGSDPILTSWNRYCLNIPPAAFSTGTRFRWFQAQSSGAGFDTWGLDNMVITLNTPGYTYDWAHDAQGPSSSPATPTVRPTATTTYTVTYTNGTPGNTCTSPITVTVIQPTVTVTANPTSICSGQSSQLTATSSLTPNPPTSCGVNLTGACPQRTIADEKKVGTGALVYGWNDGSQPTFGNFGDAYATTHILYRASEMLAAGMVAGQINSLSFDISIMRNSAGSMVYPEIKIDMGCTSGATMVNYANPAVAFSTVYNAKAKTMSVGRMDFFFDKSYNWDGVQNIVIRVCWRVAAGGSAGAMTRYAFTTDNAPGYNCLYTSGSNFEDGQCAVSGFTAIASRRPNTTFGFCKPKPLVLTYTWTPSTGLSNPTIFNPVATPGSTTTYTVSVQESGSPAACATTASVTITLPTSSLTANNGSRCGTGTVPLSVGGTCAGGTINWYNVASGGAVITTGTTFNTPSISTTTTYYAACQVGACVGTRIPVVATINPAPTITINPSPANICAGGSINLTASGASTYTWANATGLSATTGATVTASPASTTTYTVTGTLAGCTNTQTVTVNIISPPVITINPAAPAYCVGQSVSLTASGATTYSWANAAGLSSTTGATVTANPASTTTYTVTGTTGTCTGTGTVTVTVNPLPVISVPPASICSGSSTTLTASGATTYTWANSAGLSSTTGTSVTANPTTTTTYTVTGTNGSGCTGTTTVLVTVNPAPTIAVTPASATICPGGSVNLTASGATSYTWANAAGLSATTGATVTASPGSTTTYTVTGTDGNSCVNTRTVVVTVAANPVITINPAAPAYCVGQSVSLTASGATTYSWANAAGLSSTTGATVTANPASTTTYTVTGTTGTCTGTGTVTVTVNPLPVISVPPASICSGSSTTLTASGATTYTWANSAGLSSTTGTSVTANPTTTTTYTVTGTNGSGCTATTTVLVTVNPAPTIAVTPASATICPGGSVNLTASGATSYTWANAAGLSATTGATVTASPGSTTTYTVTGTDGNSCVNTRTVVVTVAANPVITINPAAPAYCVGQSVSLTASGATTYSWANAGGLSSTTGATVTANPASTTTYTVTGTTGTCTGTGTVTVTVNPLPIIMVSPSAPSYCAGGSVSLTASGASTYSWANSAGLSSTTGTSVTANPVSTTTYTVTGTNAGGCMGTTTVTVTVNPLPILSTTKTNALCNGSSDGCITLNITSSLPNYSITLNGGSPVNTSTTIYTYCALSAGVYSLNVTDAGGCTASTSATIAEPATITATTSSTGATCTNPNSGTITINSIAGGTAGYEANLDNQGYIPVSPPYTFIGQTSGTHSIDIQDVNGCIETFVVNVTAPPSAPTASSTANGVSCNGGSDGSFTITVSGGAAPYEYDTTGTGFSYAAGTNPVTFNNVNPGNHSILVQDANGCITSASATVSEPAAVTINTFFVNASCSNVNNGNITVTANGGSPAYQFSKDGGTTFVSGSSPFTFTALAPGVYDIQVKDSKGCLSMISTETVGQDADMELVQTAEVLANCNTSNGSLSIGFTPTSGGTAPFTYLWNPTLQTTGTASNIPAGTYTATVTDVNGCSASITQTLGNLAAPVLSSNVLNHVNCFGGNDGAIDATISGGASPYEISIDGINWIPLGSSTTYTNGNLSAGIYPVQVRDGAGCLSNGVSDTITEPLDILIALTKTDESCPFSSDGTITATVTGGSGSYVFNGVPGNSPYTFNNQSSGSQTITVQDANGCTKSASITVGSPSAMSATITVIKQVTCNGDNDGKAVVSVTGGTGVGTYLYDWSNGSTTDSALALIAGQYSVNITDGNGCSISALTTIFEPSRINISPSSTGVTACGVTDGTITINIMGGSGSYTANLDNQTFIPVGNSYTFTGLVSGNHSVEVKDVPNGCSETITVMVSAPPGSPTISAIPVVTLRCNGNSDGSATIQVLGGTSPYEFDTSGSGTNYFPGNSPFTVTNLKAGTKNIYVRDAANCTVIATITTNEPTAVAVLAEGIPPSCPGNSDGGIRVTVSGGNAPGNSYTYSLDGGSGIPDDNNHTFNGISDSAIAYTVDVSDVLGCPGSDTALVKPPVGVAASANYAPRVLCEGDEVRLIASATGGAPGYTFLWSDSASGLPIANTTFDIFTTTTYNVKAIDNNGCSNIKSIRVNVTPLPVPNFAVAQQGCSPYVATFNNTSTGINYVWNFGDNTTSTETNPVHTYQNAGNYTVTLTARNNLGCEVTLTKPNAVQATAQPKAMAAMTPTITEAQLINTTINLQNLSTPSDGSCFWEFGDGINSTQCSPSHTYLKAGVFYPKLTITNSQGCKDELVMSPVIILEPGEVFVPNAFSPNDDGVNDEFFVSTTGAVSYRLMVFDRWGNIIFEGKTMDAKWNGSKDGKNLPEGVYVWVVEGSLNGGTKFKRSGSVTLMR